MRWHDQLSEAQREARLPGMGDSVVRTFDTPEALDVRFHEIHAKSALNRVPGGARLPFSWTVNPYRGCLHACTYCGEGETPVLMASGRTRPLKDLQVGDQIYGTRLDGRYRHYVKTTVLDHWSTIKPAVRTTLADGTELITSGDHRFLSDRGWKHVTGAMSGAEQRPYLTTNNSLIGTGAFAEPPDQESEEYRRGYLCGLIRGDGTLGRCAVRRSAGRAPESRYLFRLALTDIEASSRAEAYLEVLGLMTKRWNFAVPAGSRPMTAISTSRRAGYDIVRDAIGWKVDPSDEWRKGFLAGIFDAEGSCSLKEALRISSTDSRILAWTESCLRHFGFDLAVEDYGKPNGLRAIRLRGGLREQLRFFHMTDPAITRKRDIEGLELKSDASLRVVSVEPLGIAMRLYDITTGTGDFIANGVVSHNCFARPTHEYLDFDAGRDFEREIVVKVNTPEVLRAELRRPSWKGEHVALGTNTDPYQWVEKRYRLTRAVWEVMLEARNPCSILTKSPMLLQDADLFEELVKVTHFSACLSIPTLDEKAWRETEPHTPHPRKRLEAVAELNARGIPTAVLVAPLMPGINDSPRQVEAVIAACEEAGATRIGGQALFLRGSTRDVFMGWLRTARPDLVQLYERLYGGRAYLRPDDKRRVEAPLRRAAWRREVATAGRFERPARAPRTAAEEATGASSDRRRAGPPVGLGDEQGVQEALF